MKALQPQRPLEGGTGAPQHRKTGACDLGRPLEVEDAELGPQVPVGERFEVELGRLAPGALEAVRGLVRADLDQPDAGHGGVAADIADLAAPRPVAVSILREVRLKDRLQNQLHCRLYDPILHGGNAQRTLPSTRLWYHYS